MSTLHKTGKICIAMLCAFFVGSIAGTVLAADVDGDGMTLEQYERLFGLDLNRSLLKLFGFSIFAFFINFENTKASYYVK